jgi:hypothetical protein
MAKAKSGTRRKKGKGAGRPQTGPEWREEKGGRQTRPRGDAAQPAGAGDRRAGACRHSHRGARRLAVSDDQALEPVS